MRVIVPYTDLRPEVEDALGDHDFDAVNVGGSDTAYWELLDELWRAAEDFAIVEQDIVVKPDTLSNFERCPKVWCCAPYPYLKSGPRGYAGLGCVRFRSSIMRACPDLMDLVARRSNALHPPKHFCTIDAWVQRSMAAAYRMRPCTAHETVGHLHLRPSHNCVPEEFLPDED